MQRPTEPVVVVRGSGDVGSAVAHRLFRAGYRVVIHDEPAPAAGRRGMAFTDAVFDGSTVLLDVEGRLVEELGSLPGSLSRRAAVLLFVGSFEALVGTLAPDVLVDARMRKRAVPECQLDLAPLTIGLGPNFVAGTTTHLVVETSWAAMGTVLVEGATAALAGEPRTYGGHARDRFIYAPLAGTFHTSARIADPVRAGEVVAFIDDRQLAAPLDGILRGLTRDGVRVEAGAKCVEVDPRGDVAHVIGIGERPAAIAEGVLTAIRQHRA